MDSMEWTHGQTYACMGDITQASGTAYEHGWRPYLTLPKG